MAIERESADRERAFVDLRFELAERALQLDHVEMLRRLDLLNHAHEDARLKEASFVGREVYESQIKDHNKWRDEVNASLSTRQGRTSVTSGLVGAVGGLALSALFGLIMFLCVEGGIQRPPEISSLLKIDLCLSPVASKTCTPCVEFQEE